MQEMQQNNKKHGKVEDIMVQTRPTFQLLSETACL